MKCLQNAYNLFTVIKHKHQRDNNFVHNYNLQNISCLENFCKEIVDDSGVGKQNKYTVYDVAMGGYGE